MNTILRRSSQYHSRCMMMDHILVNLAMIISSLKSTDDVWCWFEQFIRILLLLTSLILFQCISCHLSYTCISAECRQVHISYILWSFIFCVWSGFFVSSTWLSATYSGPVESHSYTEWDWWFPLIHYSASSALCCQCLSRNGDLSSLWHDYSILLEIFCNS